MSAVSNRDPQPDRHAAVADAPRGEPACHVGGINLTEALRLLRQGGVTAPAVPPATALTAVPDAPNLSDVKAMNEVGSGQVNAILQQVIDGLCALSTRDGLTGLSNRRSFRSELEREIERSARTGGDFGLLLIDIDHFKHVNDTYGHVAGDRVLCVLANLLATGFRPMDTVARFGGEEFAAIMPNSPLPQSRQIAERVIARIAQERIEIAPGVEISITASMGVTCARAWLTHDADALVDAADRNLYRAKREGRNRVVWDQLPDSALTGGERRLLLELSE